MRQDLSWSAGFKQETHSNRVQTGNTVISGLTCEMLKAGCAVVPVVSLQQRCEASMWFTFIIQMWVLQECFEGIESVSSDTAVRVCIQRLHLRNVH